MTLDKNDPVLVEKISTLFAKTEKALKTVNISLYDEQMDRVKAKEVLFTDCLSNEDRLLMLEALKEDLQLNMQQALYNPTALSAIGVLENLVAVFEE